MSTRALRSVLPAVSQVESTAARSRVSEAPRVYGNERGRRTSKVEQARDERGGLVGLDGALELRLELDEREQHLLLVLTGQQREVRGLGVGELLRIHALDRAETRVRELDVGTCDQSEKQRRAFAGAYRCCPAC